MTIQAIQTPLSEIDRSQTVINTSPETAQQQTENATASWWSRFRDRLVAMMFYQPEPIVEEKFDAEGSYWRLHDPESNQTLYVRSQQEVVNWLVYRARQRPRPIRQHQRR